MYTINDLSADLAIGHEVNFKFHGLEYSISQGTKGWLLTATQNGESQFFRDWKDLVENGRIGSVFLKDVWSDVVVDYIY